MKNFNIGLILAGMFLGGIVLQIFGALNTKHMLIGALFLFLGIIVGRGMPEKEESD